MQDKTIELSPGPDPERPKTYYVSYAWDDKNSEPEKPLTQIVDNLCAKGQERGIHMHRDKDEIKFGGRISEFMQNLIRGDRIIVILSDKYLKSRACMTELYGIWLQARGEDEDLLEKVRVFTHEGTKVRTAAP